jgi:hypothetical protein
MARSRDISKVLSSNTTLATDAEVAASYAPISSATFTHINSTSFTGSSSIAVDSVFSSTYRNYKIILDIDSTGGQTNIFFRFRNGSTTDTASSYNYHFNGISSTGVAVPLTANGVTQWNLMQQANTTGFGDFTIFKPFEASGKRIVGTISSGNNNYTYGNSWGGNYTSSTSFNGFILLPESFSITGVVRVYGIKN